MAMSRAQKIDAYRFFAIAFDAAPGVTFLSQLDEAYTFGLTTMQIVNIYTTKPNFLKAYPSFLSEKEFATELVENIVGAAASKANKAQAVSDILSAVDAGFSRGDVIFTIFSNLAGKSSDDPDWGATSKLMANKVEVARYYTETLRGTTEDLATLQAVIAKVTPTTDVSTAAALDAAINAGSPVLSSTFTLTVGADTLPGLIGSTGTSNNSGDDIILAAIGAANESTLNNNDVIDGGTGSDILNVRIVSLTTDVMVAPVMNNVEKVSISNLATTSQQVTLNLISAPGVATVEFKNTSTESITTVLNASASAVIVLDNADSVPSPFFLLSHGVNAGSASGRTGSADAFTINIANGSGSVDSAAGFNLINVNRSDDTSFEIANINVSGAASFVEFGSALRSLTLVNITGATVGVTTGFGLELEQASDFTNLKSVNATAMTGGGLAINAVGSTAVGFSFLGSDSADVIILSRDTLNASETLNGGGGKDILATTSFNNVSVGVNRTVGFEVLAAVNTQSSLNASSFTGIHEFLFLSRNGDMNITGVESNDRFVLEGDQRGSDETLRFTGENAGNSVVFEMRASDETGGEVTIVANTNSGNDVGAVGFRNGISSVTIDSTGQNSSANLIEAVRTGNYNFYAFNNENGLANFTITGSQSLTIAAKEGVDLSSSSRTIGFQNDANVNASSFTGVLRIAGSNSNDVITGGSGSDIIYGLIGNDTLTGNGGSDQFRMVGARGTDRIKDFVQGVDKIGANNVDFFNTTATFAGATLSALDYVDNRSGITSIGAADDKKVIELQTALSTSQIQTDAGAAVAAYVLVFNSTTSKAELWFDSNWSNGGRSQVATFDNVTSLVGLTGFNNIDFVEFIA